MKRQILHKLLFLLSFSLIAVACEQGATPPNFETSQVIEGLGEAVTQNRAEKLANQVYEPAKQILVFSAGPRDLKKGAAIEELSRNPMTLQFGIDEDMFVTRIEATITDGDGAELPANTIYKALLINNSEQHAFCQEQEGNPFAAFTSSLDPVELPKGHALAILNSDELTANIILNNVDEDLFGVTVQFKIEGIPMSQTKRNFVDVKPMLLDVNACNDQEYAIEPEEFKKQSHTFTLPESGKLVAANGILGPKGVSVGLSNQKSLLPFWEAWAQKDSKHEVVSLNDNPYENIEGVNFGQGDKITITAAHDNPLKEWQPTIGAAIAYFAENQ